MATVLTEKKHAWGFLLSEANGNRSRDNAVLAEGNNLEAGTVLQADGEKVTAFAGGSAVGILGAGTDATEADTPCAIIARDAEVNELELVFAGASPLPDADDVRADLAALGIILRP